MTRKQIVLLALYVTTTLESVHHLAPINSTVLMGFVQRLFVQMVKYSIFACKDAVRLLITVLITKHALVRNPKVLTISSV